MNDNAADLNTYLKVLRRRRKPILIVMVAVFTLVAVLAFVLPRAYRSTATILIEAQDIPSDLVRSTVSSYATERIQLISRQVMTQPNLQRIIEKFDVYPSLRQEGDVQAAVNRLRKDVALEIVSADITDPKTGRSGKATIAFTLSYNGETPEVAQQVTNELVSLFLSENIKIRTQTAAATSAFLGAEADRLRHQISDLEAKIAAFKEKNVNQLPELADLNLQMMNRAESELIALQNRMQSLEETKIGVEGQLAQTNPSTPIISVTGERILDSTERLRALQAQYTAASGVYSEGHPDLIKMRREIAALQKETGGGADIQEQVKQLTAKHSELAAMREKYSKDHPDVVKLEKSIAALERVLKTPPPVRPSAPAGKPENPAYISLQTRLQEIRSELRATQARRDELQARIAEYERRLIQTPQVEQEYRPLVREYENAVRRYDDIRAKQMQAQIAEQLETEQKAERFSVIEPPQVPEDSEGPNRNALFLIGLVLAVMAGIGYAAIAEAMDRSVRDDRAIASITGEPPLVSVPYINSRKDVLSRRNARVATVVVAATGLLGLVLIAQVFWNSSDASWLHGVLSFHQHVLE